MANLQYVGARYVPKFFENPNGSAEWLSGVPYEALTVVTYLGNSYTSKIPVPAGVDVTNTKYWVATGIFNEQLDSINEEIATMKNYVYAEEYGALGNGIADDTNAFQQALSTGKPLKLKWGKTYLISNTLILGINQTIEGDGVSSKKTDVTYKVPTINFIGTGYCIQCNISTQLKNFRIVSTTGSGVTTDMGDATPTETNVVIQNVNVRLPDKQFVGFNLGTSTGNKGSNTVLIDCTVLGGNYNYRLYSADNIMIACEGDSGNYGAYISNTQNVFTNCRFFNSYVNAISMNGTRQTAFSGCAFDQIITGRGTTVINMANGCNGVTFEGCRIYGLSKLCQIDNSARDIMFSNCFFETTNPNPDYPNLIGLSSNITLFNPMSRTLDVTKTFGTQMYINKILPQYLLKSFTNSALTMNSALLDKMGIYQIGSDTTAPDGKGYGVIITMDTGINYKARLYIPTSNNSSAKIYFQTYNGNEWSEWI